MTKFQRGTMNAVAELAQLKCIRDDCRAMGITLAPDTEEDKAHIKRLRARAMRGLGFTKNSGSLDDLIAATALKVYR